jgi:uncharacterized protein YyaL (SSP411 family)
LEDGAKQSNNNAEQMLRLSLDGGLNLIDPVWGGVYQYSTDGDWEHPHFEKIMSVQADNMRMYAQAYAVLKDQRYLAAAEKVANYVGEFLTSPQGAFYTSQDADLVSGEHSQDYFALDDAKRRARGLPKIDRHVYARENGWMIYSLCYLYAASGNESYLAQAQRAANWIWDNRQISGGGFSHDAKDNSGPYLGDNLYMARAFLALYEVTGSRSWLEKAESTAKFIAANFCMEDKSGFATIEPAKSGKLEPAFMLDENVALCRFANKLYYYSGEAQYKAMAENALSFLTQADIARSRKILIAGILLCDQEMSMEPLHVTVVGAKADAQAKALFCAANALPETYKRIEWYDRTEGSLPNSSVEFPSMPKAAAFMCANGQCSMPAYTADDLNKISKLF